MIPTPYSHLTPTAVSTVRRSADWGTISESHRGDHSVRQLRVFAPGTTAAERRLVGVTDLAPAFGAAGGLAVAAVLDATAPFLIVAFLIGGIVIMTLFGRLVSRRVRRGIRSLTVTTYLDEPGRSADEALLRSFLAEVAALDLTGPTTPVERERRWGALYFSLPAGPRPLTPLETS